MHNISWAEYQKKFGKSEDSGTPSRAGEEKPPKASVKTFEITEDFVDRVAKRVVDLQKVDPISPENSKKLPPGVEPIVIDEVEVEGEKVNYKVALNPEIFYRYNVFKAESERRGGKKWTGNFSDFLDMATKDILSVYGIHPTVVSLKGRQITVNLPIEGGENE